MNALTLQWHDAGQNKTQKISEQQPSKNPGTVRIGRDPVRCDIVLSHPTVSGLHAEIFFHPQQQRFLLRNLRGKSNPPMVDEQQLLQGEAPLNQGSVIFLGQLELKVTAVEISNVAATLLAPPQPQANTLPPKPPAQQLPHVHVKPQYHPPTPPPNLPDVYVQPQHQQHKAPAPASYGLQCPHCHRVSSIEHLQVGCRWCGTSLAAAVSVLVAPSN